MDKRGLSERHICTKFITPALRNAGWDKLLKIREVVNFTKRRIIVRGKLVTRGQGTRQAALNAAVDEALRLPQNREAPI